VPEAERSHGWAFMQMVTVNPDYAGRSRVMISNLEQSGDFEAACRNAFEKSLAQLNQQADAYLKSGNFATTSVSARALSLTRDLKPMQLDPDSGQIAIADLLLATGSASASSAYEKLHGAAAAEGFGLLALKDHKENDARRLFQSAIDSKSENARAWLEAGRLESDGVKARADLKKAAELNPNWSEPYFRMAEVEKDNLEQRAIMLKKAATFEPRNIDYWQALARTEIAARNYPEAQKAWAGAERAAANDEEKARIHQVRLQVEQERADYEEAERKRITAEREADIQRVKSQSDAAIRAAETAANKKMNPDGAAPPKAVGWYEDLHGNASVEGLFEQLVCLGRQARLVIQGADGKNIQLLVRDPSQLVIVGSGEKAFGCGAQKPPQKVLVEYIAKPDAKLRVSGEAVSIEFR
jgi:tetratricopeptide (TPR) repeat protein